MSVSDLLGQTIKGATVLRRLEYTDESGHSRYELKCSCGNTYINNRRNLKRAKVNKCKDCNKLERQQLILRARKKKKPFVFPEYRKCKSCYKSKLYAMYFPHGRHTCKKCSNIGRGAYYHRSVSE